MMAVQQLIIVSVVMVVSVGSVGCRKVPEPAKKDVTENVGANVDPYTGLGMALAARAHEMEVPHQQGEQLMQALALALDGEANLTPAQQQLLTSRHVELANGRRALGREVIEKTHAPLIAKDRGVSVVQERSVLNLSIAATRADGLEVWTEDQPLVMEELWLPKAPVCWREALVGQAVGTPLRFGCAADLYRGMSGDPPLIRAGDALVFTIAVKKIVKQDYRPAVPPRAAAMMHRRPGPWKQKFGVSDLASR